MQIIIQKGNWKVDYLWRMLSLHVFCREIKLCRKLMIKFELVQRHKVYNFVVGLSEFETIYYDSVLKNCKIRQLML